MAGPTTFASARSFYGVAKETTPGTPVPMTMTVPLEKFDPEDKYTFKDDTGQRGSAVDTYGSTQTIGHSEVSFGGSVYPDSIGFYLASLLGDNVEAGAGPYTHAFSVLNSGSAQPEALTMEDYSSVPAAFGARVWPGQQVQSLAFKWTADGVLTFEGKSTGWLSSIAGATPTSAASSEAMLPVWQLLTGIGGPASGGTLMGNVTNGELTIERSVEVVHAPNGAQQPFIIRAGKVKAMGKISLVAADETPIIAYLTAAKPQLQFVLSNGLATTFLRKVQFDIQQASYRTGKINRGKNAVMWDMDFTAESNTTNAGASGGSSPVKTTLTNAVVTGTY